MSVAELAHGWLITVMNSFYMCVSVPRHYHHYADTPHAGYLTSWTTCWRARKTRAASCSCLSGCPSSSLDVSTPLALLSAALQLTKNGQDGRSCGCSSFSSVLRGQSSPRLRGGETATQWTGSRYREQHAMENKNVRERCRQAAQSLWCLATASRSAQTCAQSRRPCQSNSSVSRAASGPGRRA